MPKTKTEEKVNVTIVDENNIEPQSQIDLAEQEHLNTAHVKVVDEPFGNLLKAKWLTFASSPMRLFALVIIASLAGFGVGYLTIDHGASNVSTGQSNAQNYTDFTNAQLRIESLNLAGELRKFLLNWGVREHQDSQALLTEIASVKSEQEQQIHWQNYDATSGIAFEARIDEFNERYKEKAISLRNELMARLPDSQDDTFIATTFAQAASPGDIRVVMDNLGELAESLLSP
jgi:hypothetical protein